MLKINNIKLAVGSTKEDIIAKVCKSLKISKDDIKYFEILKESLDARKEPYYLYSVAIDIENKNKYLKYKDISEYTTFEYEYIKVNEDIMVNVVGYGPSGIFAAYNLAKCGIKPIIFERGSFVEQRSIDVLNFWHHQILNEESNVQFGEGGAGTFSDGKLTTRVKDLRIQPILDILIENGADPKIKYQNNPHIGTDVLKVILINIRKKLIDMGAIFHFDTKVEKLIINQNQVLGVVAKNNEYFANYTILAIGHSAFDTIESIYNQQIYMELKDFAIGVRVEHPQRIINNAQYKKESTNKALPTASYRLTHQTKDNVGAYSFCMCPGGVIVGSSANSKTIVTNGMSYSKRDLPLANSAILVQIPKAMFDKGSIFDGINYQRSLEQKAYNLSNSYYAPGMNIQDYLNNELNNLNFTSSFLPGVYLYNLNNYFDDYINRALHSAFTDFDNKIPGFIKHGIMIAPETRSSSTIRIKRNEYLESINHLNLFPIGEGAGYAGGIISSALDGFKTAEKIIRKFT